MDFQRFYMGDVYDAYKYLGAHVDQSGVVFRTFAPQAERVTIIGEFNGWQEEEIQNIEFCGSESRSGKTDCTSSSTT